MLVCYGRNRGPVHWEGCGVPLSGTPRDTSSPPRPPPAYMGYCSSTVDLLQPPPTTVHPRGLPSCLHLRLFTHGLMFIQPPPLLHRLLLNQPSPQRPVQPPLHGLLFIQPSTGYSSTSPLHGILFNQPSTGYCSSSPPRGPVHPPPTGSTGVLFIQRQWPLLPRGPIHPSAIIQV